ncbi:hypothetical protein DSM104299_04557 [Baekduia alba]|uniref:class I SAM-dependent methyltransferase n=1 Tax=Baekduia alba TaxID=2997333 RepID=UPI00233F95D9|nr:class I SAM-dependent methyltransferase [Baekduia alba]WCB95806.1 hypothetical protein DSM104299_04557 [Baekduia alba]
MTTMAEPPISIAPTAGGLDVACDLCGATATTTVLRTPDVRYGLGGDFALARCTSCGLQRTLPQPADAGAYYPADEYYIYQPPAAPAATAVARVRHAYGLDAGGDAGARSLRTRLAARVAVDRLSPGLPPGPPGDILDVGCGSGDFLLLLAAAGWRPHGVEPDAQAVAAAHAAGLAGVHHGDLTELGLDAASFDAVRFWHSLEHVSSPRAQLTAARRVVRDGGSLTIGVPNVGSLLSRTARKRWYYLDMPRHLWHFDRRRLSALVQECGFRVESARLVSTGSAVLGTAGYLSGKGERVLESRRAWYAALGPAMALDAVGLGDAIHLTARAV